LTHRWEIVPQNVSIVASSACSVDKYEYEYEYEYKNEYKHS